MRVFPCPDKDLSGELQKAVGEEMLFVKKGMERKLHAVSENIVWGTTKGKLPTSDLEFISTRGPLKNNLTYGLPILLGT